MMKLKKNNKKNYPSQLGLICQTLNLGYEIMINS